VALNGGGTVSFNCGPAPHIIYLTNQKSINNDATIEGGNLITLSGGNSTRLFDVGAVLILRDIVLTNGYFNGDGGAIRNNANGTLALDNVTIQNSTATLSGGAIVSYGPLNILDSWLTESAAIEGGALYLRFSSAQTNIVNSRLSSNQTPLSLSNGHGGAILLWDGATATLQGTEILGNTSSYGGGIHITANASLVMEDSELVANEAYVGGGIVNYGTVTLNRVDLVGNAADIEAYGAFGGGLYNRNSLALLTDVNFIANYSSDFGGGMANKQSTSYLSNVTFRSNNATYEGGGFYYSESLVTMSNVTFSDNRGWSEGGGIRSFDSISTLTNVTFNSNFSASGGGINFYAIDPASTMTLKNTIVANSVSSGDCMVEMNSINGISSAGYNLSSDNSCNAYFTHPADQTNMSPSLGPLADNGGYTWTHLPYAHSPVVDEGLCLAQIPTDQRGVARPQGPACDIGAVEREESDNTAYLYLPFMIGG